MFSACRLFNNVSRFRVYLYDPVVFGFASALCDPQETAGFLDDPDRPVGRMVDIQFVGIAVETDRVVSRSS